MSRSLTVRLGVRGWLEIHGFQTISVVPFFFRKERRFANVYDAVAGGHGTQWELVQRGRRGHTANQHTSRARDGHQYMRFGARGVRYVKRRRARASTRKRRQPAILQVGSHGVGIHRGHDARSVIA